MQKYAICFFNFVFFFRADEPKDNVGSFLPKDASVNLADLVKSFQTSIYYLLANIGVDTAENGLLKVCQKLASCWKKLE